MPTSSYFQSQVIWITGASSGIGEALAYACSQRGARLVLSARRQAELERVRSQCANPDAHLVLPLDLADFDAVTATAQVLGHFGQIDVLVNNGGISQRGTVVETELAVDRRIMEINYFGAVALTKAVLPTMIGRKTGHIVTISSLSGKISTPRRSAYAASKHALHGFFDALRSEVYQDGVRVLLVCPGYVKTNISFNALTGGGQAHGQLDPTQERGIAPEALAEKILAAVEQEKDEVLVGGKEVLAVYLKRLWPGLYNWFIRRRKIT